MSQLYYKIIYSVISILYHSFLTIVVSVANANAIEDNSALQTLFIATGSRVNNEAVTSLLKAQSLLSAYKSVLDLISNLTEISVIGQFYVKTVYFSETIDLAITVNMGGFNNGCFKVCSPFSIFIEFLLNIFWFLAK